MSRIENIFKALNQKIEEAETIDDIKPLLKVMSSILELKSGGGTIDVRNNNNSPMDSNYMP